MPSDHEEKRDFKRVDVSCEIRYRLEESMQEQTGTVTNLSGRGMMFIVAHEVELESYMEVKIAPENDLTPPLHARVKVVRTCKQRHGDGYEVGAVIQETLDE